MTPARVALILMIAAIGSVISAGAAGNGRIGADRAGKA
jgi:hypothetical protein